MTDREVLIIGAGVAGLSAASTLAEHGIKVRVIDMAHSLGGNIYRQPVNGSSRFPMTKEHRKSWARIHTRFQKNSSNIKLDLNKRFAGIDRTGTVFISDPSDKKSELLKPVAVIIATGSSERVMPRNGWTLPGVKTAGAIQTAMKMSGKAPSGRVILAGSGPLLLAVGAQMTKLGNPPLCILEAGQPFSHPLKALKLPKEYIFEAIDYAHRLRRANVQILTGATISQISQATSSNEFEVEIRNSKGQTHRILATEVGLHDGLLPSDPFEENFGGMLVRKSGDCLEINGGRAAEIDGARTGQEIAGMLLGKDLIDPGLTRKLDRHRDAQRTIAEIYANNAVKELANLQSDTVICRCENRTLNDLEALNDQTAKEVRLVGRFGMGACQGRFCTHWVEKLRETNENNSSAKASNRWPVRPVSIRSLVEADYVNSITDETKA